MKKKQVFIVDDDEQLLKLFSLAFSDAGYEVFTASAAEPALKIMEHNAYPLIISDLNMPGISGIELSRLIHKKWPMTMLIAVTGYASLFQLSDCREAGFEDYFIKPVEIKKLIEAADHCYEKIKRWKHSKS